MTKDEQELLVLTADMTCRTHIAVESVISMLIGDKEIGHQSLHPFIDKLIQLKRSLGIPGVFGEGPEFPPEPTDTKPPPK